MARDALEIPRFSGNALFLFGDLRRHGGSMRIAPLLRDCGLDADATAAAANQLNERRRVNVNWRRPRTHMRPACPSASASSTASPPPASAATAIASPGRRGRTRCARDPRAARIPLPLAEGLGVGVSALSHVIRLVHEVGASPLCCRRATPGPLNAARARSIVAIHKVERREARMCGADRAWESGR